MLLTEQVSLQNWLTEVLIISLDAHGTNKTIVLMAEIILKMFHGISASVHGWAGLNYQNMEIFLNVLVL